MQRLLSLIKLSKSGYDKLGGTSLWVIDSGPSYHMTRDLDKLRHKTSITPISMTLPNRAGTIGSLQGSMNLCLKITLDKVLCILNFS